jgi:dTDP-4-amino-4,6-dideoxygalactose transaminase
MAETLTAGRVLFMRTDRQFAAIREPATAAVRAVLESGRALQGPATERLEARLARRHGLAHAVAVNSGTDALIFALAGLGLPEGSPVAVPALSFIASASAVLHVRCRPVFVDIDPETMLMDTDAVLDLIGRRAVRAIVAVHLYGQMVDLEGIGAHARECGIAVIEDAAQALGSSCREHPPGAFSDATCLSFDPTKVIGACGSGGALLTDDPRIAETARLLRYHGHAGNRRYARPGFNSQMDEIQAALLDVKLDHLEEWQAARAAIALRFEEALDGCSGLRRVRTLPGRTHNHHKFVVVARGRDRLQRELASRGIETSVHYGLPLHQQPCCATADSPRLPHAEAAAQQVLSLPMYAELTPEELERIVAAIREVGG